MVLIRAMKEILPSAFYKSRVRNSDYGHETSTLRERWDSSLNNCHSAANAISSAGTSV